MMEYIFEQDSLHYNFLAMHELNTSKMQIESKWKDDLRKAGGKQKSSSSKWMTDPSALFFEVLI